MTALPTEASGTISQRSIHMKWKRGSQCSRIGSKLRISSEASLAMRANHRSTSRQWSVCAVLAILGDRPNKRPPLQSFALPRICCGNRAERLSSGMPSFEPYSSKPEVDRPRSGRDGSGLRGAPLERPASTRKSSRSRAFQPAWNNHTTAKPGCLVHFYYRTRTGPTRHFRFRSSRCSDSTAVFIDVSDRSAAMDGAARAIYPAAVRLSRDLVAPRNAVLAIIVRTSGARHHHANAHQLPAGSGRTRDFRHGHARSSGHAGHLQLLHG